MTQAVPKGGDVLIAPGRPLAHGPDLDGPPVALLLPVRGRHLTATTTRGSSRDGSVTAKWKFKRTTIARHELCPSGKHYDIVLPSKYRMATPKRQYDS